MGKVSNYGIGCGSVLVLGGVVELIGLILGWGESNRAIFQILEIVGDMVGSQYLGAGVFIVVGTILILLGLGFQEILAEKRPEKDKTAGTAKPQGLPPSQQFYGRELSKAESYINFVEGNLIRNGFEPVPFSQDIKAFYKRDFGRRSSEFYFILGRVNGLLTPEKVEKISQRTFEYVSKRKQANKLFCYPVMVSEDVPADVQKFIRSYSPKHMAQFEFPVIVDLSSRNSYYYTGTPLWGGVMYHGIRENADALLKMPKA